MSHLIAIVIALISTVVVGKQQCFVFQGTWLMFGARLLPALLISRGNPLENITYVLPSREFENILMVISTSPSALATSWAGHGD